MYVTARMPKSYYPTFLFLDGIGSGQCAQRQEKTVTVLQGNILPTIRHNMKTVNKKRKIQLCYVIVDALFGATCDFSSLQYHR